MVYSILSFLTCHCKGVLRYKVDLVALNDYDNQDGNIGNDSDEDI